MGDTWHISIVRSLDNTESSKFALLKGKYLETMIFRLVVQLFLQDTWLHMFAIISLVMEKKIETIHFWNQFEQKSYKTEVSFTFQKQLAKYLLYFIHLNMKKKHLFFKSVSINLWLDVNNYDKTGKSCLSMI